MQWKKIEPEQFNRSTFDMVGNQWTLITAQKPDGTVNTMTASWGGMGILWRKNVVFVFIRPQRYTKEFVDQAGKFTLTFFDEKYKKELSYLGSVSGRDENKIAKANLTVEQLDQAPVFEQANTAIICRTLYTQTIDPAQFKVPEMDERWYAEKDYHTVYVAEIEGLYVKE